MKRLGVILIGAMCWTLTLQAMSGDDLKNPRSYGEELGESAMATLAAIIDAPEEYNKKIVKLAGTIDEVCANKGCWMFITDGKNRIRVDFKNYGFFMPWDSEGKRVILEGKVNHKLVDKNVLKHWAEDSKDGSQNPDDITEDRMMVMFTASGVVMENGSPLSAEQQDVLDGKTTKEH